MTLDAPTQPFSTRLREATWARHERVDPTAAESAAAEEPEKGLLSALFDGELHLDDYAAWTAQQYFVYQVLETAAEKYRDHPVAGAFVFDEAARLPAFDADLSLLYGPRWRDKITPLASTQRYVNRLRAVCFDWPAGFVAHQYTRYLGDMSGGQAFRTAANDLYGFDDGPGVRFYVFDQVPDLTEFKNEYRRRLNDAGWDDAEQRRIIDEVLDAYDYNEAFLSELSANMRRSV